MPTAMHVYRELGARYGVDVTSREALSHFFDLDLPQLPTETQRAIAEQRIEIFIKASPSCNN